MPFKASSPLVAYLKSVLNLTGGWDSSLAGLSSFLAFAFLRLNSPPAELGECFSDREGSEDVEGGTAVGPGFVTGGADARRSGTPWGIAVVVGTGTFSAVIGFNGMSCFASAMAGRDVVSLNSSLRWCPKVARVIRVCLSCARERACYQSARAAAAVHCPSASLARRLVCCCHSIFAHDRLFPVVSVHASQWQRAVILPERGTWKLHPESVCHHSVRSVVRAVQRAGCICLCYRTKKQSLVSSLCTPNGRQRPTATATVPAAGGCAPETNGSGHRVRSSAPAPSPPS